MDKTNKDFISGKKIVRREPIVYNSRGKLCTEIVIFEDNTSEVRMYNRNYPMKRRVIEYSSGFTRSNNDKK